MSNGIWQKETEEILEPLVTPVICDICSNSCFVVWGLENSIEGNNHCARLFAQWGFGSPKDLEIHSCCMCESCYEKVAAFITQTLGGSISIESYVPRLARASAE